MSYRIISWTPDEEKLCRDMVAANHSSREIGKALSRSRNAIIGYCQRHGLILGWTKRVRAKRLLPKPQKKEKQARKPRQINNTSLVTLQRPKPIPGDHCHYLFGEPRYQHFCDHPAEAGSYCFGHYRMTHLVSA